MCSSCVQFCKDASVKTVMSGIKQKHCSSRCAHIMLVQLGGVEQQSQLTPQLRPCLLVYISKQHETSRGQLVNLLRVAGEPSVDLAVRQVASITFKHAAKRHWEPEKEGE
jgi:hypothetical protein